MYKSVMVSYACYLLVMNEWIIGMKHVQINIHSKFEQKRQGIILGNDRKWYISGKLFTFYTFYKNSRHVYIESFASNVHVLYNVILMIGILV